MGDCNLDLLATHNTNIELYSELMLEHNLYLLINKPTKITPTSCSDIDHIWTNITKIDIKSLIVVHKVSDHLGVIQISNVGSPLLEIEHYSGWHFTQTI